MKATKLVRTADPVEARPAAPVKPVVDDLQLGDLVLRGRVLSRGEQSVKLPRMRAAVLRKLMERGRSAVSVADLMRAVPGRTLTLASVRVHITEVRAALLAVGRAPESLENVKGYGYLLAD